MTSFLIERPTGIMKLLQSEIREKILKTFKVFANNKEKENLKRDTIEKNTSEKED